EPASSVMLPPELLVTLPPSALTTPVEATVRFNPASRAAHPPEFDPAVETSTSAFTLMEPSASAVTPPPFPVVRFVTPRLDVTAALIAMFPAEQRLMQPPSPTPSARTAPWTVSADPVA